MASNDVQKFSNQFQYNGEGPLDAKLAPVATMSDLPNALKAYEGQTLTVLSDSQGETADYQYINGKWVKKCQVIDCGMF